ncbi:MAG: hypothetical protein M1819_001215 [Sarea resinae]|nr:MAG: hypothetical protein M1819_001215 [Sarea resinae]
MAGDSHIIREVGNLERLSTARHSLGIYRCVIVTARYCNGNFDSEASFKSFFFSALSRVVLRHPALCCGFVDEDKRDASFVGLREIDLNRVVRFQTYDSGDGPSYENGQRKLLEHEHLQLWEHLETNPGWRVVVSHLPQADHETVKSQTSMMDVVFAFHHAVGDGLSGAVFHRSLLKELRSTTSTFDPTKPCTPLVQLPEKIELVEPVEKLLKFSFSLRFICGFVFRALIPSWLLGKGPIWAGAQYYLSSPEEFKTHVRHFSIPQEQLKCILSACKAKSVTLTGLLHGLHVTLLAQMVPDADRLSGHTPYSLRRLIPKSEEEVAVQVSVLEIDFPSRFFRSSRNAAGSGEPDWEEVWKVARYYGKLMQREVDRAPKDNVVGLLGFIGDYHDHYRKLLQKKRKSTYEISNIGVFGERACISSADVHEDGSGWGIHSMIFTGSGMVTGPALGATVVSVQGGPLSIAFTWQDGIFEEAFVDNFVDNLETSLRELSSKEEKVVSILETPK